MQTAIRITVQQSGGSECNYDKRENLKWAKLEHSNAPTELLKLFDTMIKDKIKDAYPTLQENEQYQQASTIIEDGWEMLHDMLADNGKEILRAVGCAEVVSKDIEAKQLYRKGFIDALRLMGNKHLVYLLQDCNFIQAAYDEELIPLPEQTEAS